VRPKDTDLPHWLWNRDHLTELAVVSVIEIEPWSGPETEIVIDEAPGPECPRCWRRTGHASGSPADPNLCDRCAAVVATVATRTMTTPASSSGSAS
jgi:hypothetical protein